jgi:hypothetical protein
LKIKYLATLHLCSENRDDTFFPPKIRVSCENEIFLLIRVPRFGEFCNYMKITEVVHSFGLLHSTGKFMNNFNKFGSGYNSGEFFTNSSGHPAFDNRHGFTG